MRDPFGSMQNFMGQFQSFMQDPTALLCQRIGLSRDALANPAKTIQQLMDSGRMSQQQYNYLKRVAGEIQKSPMFGKMFNIK